MLNGDEAVRSLREALELSPENLPLRQHLADTLLSFGRAAEAEVEYRQGLAQAPNDLRLKFGLAQACDQQGKNDVALVLIEDLLRQTDPAPRAYLMHARLLLRTGEVQRAAQQYRRALEFDPSLSDPDLAARLGIGRSSPERPTREPAEDEPERVRVSWEEAFEPASTEVERPALTFADVGGMEDVKNEVRMKIIYPLTHPELYAAYGKAIGGGILLYGPPGCGKTYLARATAGEIKAGFISVGLNEVLDMYIGQSERNLHEVFEQARRNTPCVIFFDEVDALGASRSDLRHSSGRMIINQFLSELDGVDSNNEGLLILAATNSPWHLDAAFRRPGRFDRLLFVPPPDQPARAEILRVQLRGKPLENVDFDNLAKRTDAFSGADLKALVDQAVEKKLEQAMREGVPKPITTKDLVEATSRVKPSTKEWFATARNHALYANQGGIYDDIVKYLKLI
jgi:transitional endoplasmic reticulum ATPase